MNAVSESMIQQITECMKWKEMKTENGMTWKNEKWNLMEWNEWMNERRMNE